jgi:hypothetical protein
MTGYDTKTGKGLFLCPLHDRGFTGVTVAKDLAHVIKSLWAETPERQGTKILPTPPQKDILALAAQYLSMNTSVPSAKTETRYRKQSPILASVSMYGFNFRGRSNCASRNSRTYVALFGRLVGWLVASFFRSLVIGWSHFRALFVTDIISERVVYLLICRRFN